MKCKTLPMVFIAAWAFHSALAQVGPAKLSGGLQNDVNGNARPGTNDTIRYLATLTNNTGQALSNTIFSAPNVTNAALVAGSLRVSPIARADSLSTVSNVTLAVSAP